MTFQLLVLVTEQMVEFTTELGSMGEQHFRGGRETELFMNEMNM